MTGWRSRHGGDVIHPGYYDVQRSGTGLKSTSCRYSPMIKYRRNRWPNAQNCLGWRLRSYQPTFATTPLQQISYLD